jgi:hypothetical protein
MFSAVFPAVLIVILTSIEAYLGVGRTVITTGLAFIAPNQFTFFQLGMIDARVTTAVTVGCGQFIVAWASVLAFGMTRTAVVAVDIIFKAVIATKLGFAA